MNYTFKEKFFNKNQAIFWVGLLVIMVLRNFYFVWTYFPYLDDHNAYGIFFNRARNMGNVWENIIVYYNLLAHRPVVDLLDAYVFQWFWQNMQWLLLFFTLLHFGLVYIFYDILKKSNINFGITGILVLALFPGLFEAVYWISASTRIVLGMFFVLSSVFFALKKNIWSFAILNIISTGFYEQIIVFNLAFTLAILFINKFNKKIYYVIPIVSTFIIGVHYIFFLDAGRRGGNQLVSFNNLFSHWLSLFMSIVNTVLFVNMRIIRHGFFRGISFVNFSIIIVIAYIVFLYLYKQNKQKNDDKINIFKILFGIVFSIIPFLPFFIINSTWLPPRTTFISFFGIAIILDDLLISHAKKLVPLLIIPMFFVYVAELDNFRMIYRDDKILIENFLALDISSYRNIIILDSPIISSPVTYPGNHRLENISSSNWAFQGGVNATSGEQFRTILPVRQWNVIPIVENPIFLRIDNDLNIFVLKYIDGMFLKNDVVFGLDYLGMFRRSN